MRLSARRVVRKRRGRRFVTGPTAVASVGATIAPRAIATGTESAARYPMPATAAAVTSTSGIADSRMTRRFLRISRTEVLIDSQ